LCGTEGFVYQAAMALHVSGRANASGPRTHRRGRTLFRSALRGVLSAAVVGAPLLVPAPIVYADPADTTAVVLKVVDGDTVDIRDDVRGRLRIRLLGIDTPGTKNPATRLLGTRGHRVREVDAARAASRADIRPVPRSSRQIRALAYLDKADGWDYSIEAARAGAAHAYVYHDKPAARSPAIAAAEQEAKDAQRGLWGPPCHGTPRPFPIRTRGPWCR